MNFQLKITLKILTRNRDVDDIRAHIIIDHNEFLARSVTAAQNKATSILNKIKSEYPKRRANEVIEFLSCDAELRELREIARFCIRPETQKQREVVERTKLITTCLPAQ